MALSKVLAPRQDDAHCIRGRVPVVDARVCVSVCFLGLSALNKVREIIVLISSVSCSRRGNYIFLNVLRAFA